MKKTILIILLFSILTAGMTYPLIFKTKTHIPGIFDTTEVYAMLWEGWRFKYARLNNLDMTSYHLTSYPFGVPSVKIAEFPVGIGLIKWLSILTNEVFMYNFQVLLSFLLSGLFAFLLVYYLTKNSSAAVFSGIIYAFCPYHFARVWQHLGLLQIQWLPLYLFALFRLKDERKVKNSVLVVLSFFLFSENYTYVYFMVIATIIFVLAVLFFKSQQEKFKFIKLLLLSIFLIFFITLPATYIVYRGFIFGPPKEAVNSFYRPFEDLFLYSARPLSYFLPSFFHPIFGRLTEMFIGSGYYGKNITEHTLYLGWIPLAFAFLALYRWRRKISSPAAYETVLAGERFSVGFFIALTVVAWLFSQPPWWRIGPVKIYMPSFFMYHLLPMIRAYCRFGVVVVLAISALAGFGLKYLLMSFKRQRTKVFIAVMFSSLVLFEFINFPPFRIIDLTKYPRVYDWLSQQPDSAVIAEYPLDLKGPNDIYRFYQTKHHKRMLNCTQPGTYANKVSQTLRNLSEYKTAEKLKWLGLEYILVHTDAYRNNENNEEKKEIEGIRENKGLKFLEQFDDIVVYQVTAKPLKADIN